MFKGQVVRLVVVDVLLLVVLVSYLRVPQTEVGREILHVILVVHYHRVWQDVFAAVRSVHDGMVYPDGTMGL